MTLKPNMPLDTISTDRFSWDKTTRTFSEEISSLPDLHVRRVFNDACDVGFNLTSAASGKTITLVWTDRCVSKGADPEILWDEFRPIDPQYRNLLRVVLFND